jgi:serine/threonine-protein kinase RIO1
MKYRVKQELMKDGGGVWNPFEIRNLVRLSAHAIQCPHGLTYVYDNIHF